ncbi:MAG: DUF971 domain-containing protein [bacterium]
MRPNQIKLDKNLGELRITWDDGMVEILPIKLLRDECPCAGCKGEVLFGKMYKPAPLTVFAEGMYEIVTLKAVGQYAIQIDWKDGHDTGIYSWEYLRALHEAVTGVTPDGV